MSAVASNLPRDTTFLEKHIHACDPALIPRSRRRWRRATVQSRVTRRRNEPERFAGDGFAAITLLSFRRQVAHLKLDRLDVLAYRVAPVRRQFPDLLVNLLDAFLRCRPR